MINTVTKSVVASFCIATLIYLAIYKLVPTNHYITVLNSVFVASAFVVFITQVPLLWHLTINPNSYNRERHYVIGIFLLWSALCVLIANSITIRATIPDNLIPNNDILATLGRYIGIVSAAYQVTAPDYGEPVMYGRDRRLLWLGIALGLIGGIIAAHLQNAGYWF